MEISKALKNFGKIAQLIETIMGKRLLINLERAGVRYIEWQCIVTGTLSLGAVLERIPKISNATGINEETLEEMLVISGVPQEDIPPTCPTCGSGSTRLHKMYVSVPNGPRELKTVYQCTNPECVVSVPYPESSDARDTSWPTEFIVDGGKKIIVRPAASEFA